MKTGDKKTKVCYVLAYKDPEYVRTRALLGALNGIESTELIKAINKHKGLVRYLETPLKVLWARIKNRPDIYIVGFSGYEIFWLIRILTWPKPIIFDEFINAYDWFVIEHNKIPEGSLRAKLLRRYVRSILNNSYKILTDTWLHAQSSSKTYDIPIGKYQVVYVGTDEKLFKPTNASGSNSMFTIFFYGNFLPLHGIEYILGAARRLHKLPIKFIIIGGGNKKEELKRFHEYVSEHSLKNIEHYSWVDFEKLPKYITNADLCLGGPFGNTPQSQKVITGKTFQFLAMGKPVVVGSIKEDAGFRDKVNVIEVNQGSAISLTRAIEWAYDNKNKLKAIGENGKDLYFDKFSLQAARNKLKKLLNSVDYKSDD